MWRCIHAFWFWFWDCISTLWRWFSFINTDTYLLTYLLTYSYSRPNSVFWHSDIFHFSFTYQIATLVELVISAQNANQKYFYRIEWAIQNIFVEYRLNKCDILTIGQFLQRKTLGSVSKYLGIKFYSQLKSSWKVTTERSLLLCRHFYAWLTQPRCTGKLSSVQNLRTQWDKEIVRIFSCEATTFRQNFSFFYSLDRDVINERIAN